jgi:hypothetical protein
MHTPTLPGVWPPAGGDGRVRPTYRCPPARSTFHLQHFGGSHASPEPSARGFSATSTADQHETGVFMFIQTWSPKEAVITHQSSHC